SRIQIPESIYEKFRKNQGLDYSSFIKKYKEFGFENIGSQPEKNYVSVIENDDSQIGKVFFYKPKKDGIVEKVIRVPIHTTQLNKS
ncbi:MAG: hypothetical protein KBS61_09580, partial [Chryseobacterium sp.]|nr:hypothetical protein [Candidatus Chryseobacterium enterohippi]